MILDNKTTDTVREFNNKIYSVLEEYKNLIDSKTNDISKIISAVENIISIKSLQEEVKKYPDLLSAKKTELENFRIAFNSSFKVSADDSFSAISIKQKIDSLNVIRGFRKAIDSLLADTSKIHYNDIKNASSNLYFNSNISISDLNIYPWKEMNTYLQNINHKVDDITTEILRISNVFTKYSAIDSKIKALNEYITGLKKSIDTSNSNLLKYISRKDSIRETEFKKNYI